MLKIYQLNIGRNESEQIELINDADKRDIEVICIQEPYTNKYTNLAVNINNKYDIISINNSGKRPKAATVLKKNLDYLVNYKLSNENNVVIVLDGLVIVSTYFNCYEYETEERNKARNIETDLNWTAEIIDKYKNRELVIAMDSNARHSAWSDDKTNERGIEMFNFIIQHELLSVNVVNAGPTFTKWVVEQDATEKTERRSWIDLTLTNFKASVKIIRWDLDSVYFDTEHKLICFVYLLNKREKIERSTIAKIDFANSDLDLFFKIFAEKRPNLKEVNYEYVIEKFNSAMEKAITKLKKKTIDVVKIDWLPWYNASIDNRCL